MPSDTELIKKYPILIYFDFVHLRPFFQAYAVRFRDEAFHLAAALPYNPETSTALRKLLEAKDCALRSALGLLEQDDE